MAQTYAGNLPTITADFNGIPVTIIERDGQRWLTAEQIGLALGYSQANARDGIIKLCNRHMDELSKEDTCTVKLAAQGQMREMRIFSATGCIKLGFFASTPKAKEFRTWSSEVLAEQSGQSSSAAPVPAPQEQASELLGHHVVELTRQVTLLMRQVGSLSRKVITTQTKLVKAQERTIALVEGHMSGAEATATILRMESEGKSRAAIVAATGRTFNHVRQVVFQARTAGTLPPLPKDAASTQTNLFKGA